MGQATAIWHAVLVIVILTMMSGRAEASGDSWSLHGRQQTVEDRADYVPGQILIRLNERAGEMIEAARGIAGSPTTTGIGWFDALNARYGVTNIEGVFEHAFDLDTIRERFPERARRAPWNDPEPPSLRYVYKLTLRPEIDVRQAVADYAAQPDVLYAEPNYLATTQPAKPPVRSVFELLDQDSR